jgi:hypothetical protein
MSTDPILDLFGLVYRRTILFIALSLLQAAALWLWLLIAEFGVTRGDLLFWLRVAWTPPTDNKLAAVITYGCLTIGLLSTSVIYLVISKWWQRRGDVYHRRGARLEDGAI